MDFDEQYEAERQHIRHRRRLVEKWDGDLERLGLPSYGWLEVDCHEYRGRIRPICSACSYRGLHHAVVIKHLARKMTIVVGPHCAENATG